MAVKFNRKFNVNRVVKRLIYTILGLYVGGTIMTVFGNVMNATSSPFYTGLSLIGWTVATVNNGTFSACGYGASTGTINNCIVATNGSGVLSVVGIIGIGSVVTEFISW